MTENEQLVREGYEAWNRGDWERMEELFVPDFEVDATDRVLNPDRYLGIDGFRRMADEMWEVWDSWQIEPEEFIERGDVMFVRHQIHARGKGSGLELQQTYWSVWTIRDGLAEKLALFVNEDHARTAAGLPSDVA